MKIIRTFVTLFAISGLVYACGDEGPDNFSEDDPVAELAGNYTGSKFEYTHNAGVFPAIDLVGLGGAVTVNLAADGSFTATLTLPGTTTPVPFDGTISISGTTLTLTVSDTVTAGPIELLPEEPFVFTTFTLSGNQLTLSSIDVEFDFTLGMCGSPPCPEFPASLVLILNR